MLQNSLECIPFIGILKYIPFGRILEGIFALMK